MLFSIFYILMNRKLYRIKYKQMTEHRTNFYPASYLVMVVTSLLLVGAAAGLGAVLIDYWLNGVSSILNDMMIFYWTASLVVVAPIHLLSYLQVRRTDRASVTTFSLRFAHGLLGMYLFITVGSIISLSTWLLALWMNAWLGTGDIDKHLLSATLSLLQAIAWFAYATWHFMRSRTNQSRPKYYILTVGILASVLLILTLVFPAMAYRDKARDFVKENDLSQINQAIGDYVDWHNTLPSKLSDLGGLSEHTSHRLNNYSYTSRGGTEFGIYGYTLCATFVMSSDKGRDVGFGFWSHGAGEQCFTRTTISFDKLNQDLANRIKGINAGAVKLQAAIQSFLWGAKQTVDQEIAGVESFASGQVKQLEANLEGLEGGTTELQQEMKRLESNMDGLKGDTGELANDFAAVQKFLHDLECIFGGCEAS